MSARPTCKQFRRGDYMYYAKGRSIFSRVFRLYKQVQIEVPALCRHRCMTERHTPLFVIQTPLQTQRAQSVRESLTQAWARPTCIELRRAKRAGTSHTKHSQKAGPFSVARLKIDLPSHNNRLACNRVRSRSASPLGAPHPISIAVAAAKRLGPEELSRLGKQLVAA